VVSLVWVFQKYFNPLDLSVTSIHGSSLDGLGGGGPATAGTVEGSERLMIRVDRRLLRPVLENFPVEDNDLDWTTTSEKTGRIEVPKRMI
jgi:hypothetical protein